MNLLDNYHSWQRQRLLGKTTSVAMRDFLQTQQPQKNAFIEDCDFLALDMETTGISPKKDDILSLGYVSISANKIQLNTAKHVLIKTHVDVGQSATIHGIHDQHIEADGKELKQVIDSLLADLAGKVLLVHYAQLDFAMLNKICQSLYDIPLLCPVVDTLAIEHRQHQRKNQNQLPALQLDACRERYGLPRYSAHSAINDAIATAELWLAQCAYRQGKQQLRLRTFIS